MRGPTVALKQKVFVIVLICSNLLFYNKSKILNSARNKYLCSGNELIKLFEMVFYVRMMYLITVNYILQ